MGRSWQFILLVAVVLGTSTVMYYSSDFYAKRAAEEATPAPAEAAPPDAVAPPVAPAAPAPSGNDGPLPSNE
jgi:hypothetical protein